MFSHVHVFTVYMCSHKNRQEGVDGLREILDALKEQ